MRKLLNLKKTLLVTSIISLMGFYAGTASADYPDRRIRLVVPFAPGGGVDALARPLAKEMSEILKQSVYIENKASATGQTGAIEVAKAKPDGYTLLISSAAFGTTPIFYPSVPYSPTKDFSIVSVLAASPQILVTSKKFPAKSVKELIEMAKSGKQVNFALTGVSGMQALAAALLESQAGIKFTKVPYKGAGAALPDLIGGTVDIMFDNPGSSLPNVTGGRLNLLATTSLERMPALKTTETVSETLKGFEALNWFVLAAPAGTPKDILDKINAAATQAIKSDSLKPFIDSNGIIIIADKPSQAQEFINKDVEKWSKLVKAQGLQLE